MKAIHPITPLTNRSLKRKYTNEVKKIATQIDDIQVSFELSVFESPKHLTYKELYDYFLESWMELVDKILKVYKLNYCFIDLHFFERKYRSVV